MASENWLISWIGLEDTDGGKVAYYSARINPRPWNPLSYFVWQPAIEVLYFVGSTLMAAAIGLLGLVINPNVWLDPLTNAYTSVTQTLYQWVNPIYISLIFLIVLLWRIYTKKPPKAQGNKPAVARNKELMNDITAALAIEMIVVAATNNPFALIKGAMNIVLAFVAGLTGNGDAAGGVGNVVAAANVDGVLRVLTFMITYGSVLSEECAATWSKTVESGDDSALKACLTDTQQQTASYPGILSVFSALALVALSLCLAYFVWYAAKYFFNAIGLMIFYLGTLAWRAAVSLAGKKAFTQLQDHLVKGVTHGVIALIVMGITALGPTLATKLIASLTFLPLVLQMLLVGVAYVFLGKGMKRMFSNRETLFKTIAGHLNSKYQSAAYVERVNKLLPEKPILGQALGNFVPGSMRPWIDSQKAKYVDPILAGAANRREKLVNSMREPYDTARGAVADMMTRTATGITERLAPSVVLSTVPAPAGTAPMAESAATATAAAAVGSVTAASLSTPTGRGASSAAPASVNLGPVAVAKQVAPVQAQNGQQDAQSQKTRVIEAAPAGMPALNGPVAAAALPAGAPAPQAGPGAPTVNTANVVMAWTVYVGGIPRVVQGTAEEILAVYGAGMPIRQEPRVVKVDNSDVDVIEGEVVPDDAPATGAPARGRVRQDPLRAYELSMRQAQARLAAGAAAPSPGAPAGNVADVASRGGAAAGEVAPAASPLPMPAAAAGPGDDQVTAPTPVRTGYEAEAEVRVAKQVVNMWRAEGLTAIPTIPSIEHLPAEEQPLQMTSDGGTAHFERRERGFGDVL